MAITKDKKKEIIADLKKILKDSKSVTFVNFHGLSVKDASELRRSLKKENVGYLVTKKTLFGKALEAAGIESVPKIEGEFSLAYLGESGIDEIAPARGIYEFQKKLDGKVKIIGGIFDGGYKSEMEMTNIARIPSLQMLRGMFVNIINSPVQRFVIGLNQIALKSN